jgi:hypothetical protein
MNLRVSTKGAGAALNSNSSASTLVFGRIWTPLSATVVAPAWSGDLQYAYLTVGSPAALALPKFYLDDVDIREATIGRYFHRRVLSPSLNPFGAGTNSQGIYWIDCQNNSLIIDRSRILGTLLVVNPGPGSCVTGPVQWSPAVPGYPVLLVDADFKVAASNQVLSELDNGVNYNPVGAAHDTLSQDADLNDIYLSEIRGLVAVADGFSFQNSPLVRGQIIVGGDVSNSSGSLTVEYEPNSLLNPPPGFLAPYQYIHRPGSEQKTLAP